MKVDKLFLITEQLDHLASLNFGRFLSKNSRLGRIRILAKIIQKSVYLWIEMDIVNQMHQIGL